jgi:dCMP deaminase
MAIAKQVAARATCDRLRVGAILVRDKRIISSGYNGSLPGQPHCDTVGHLMIEGHCQRTNHSEANLIAQAAKFGENTNETTVYVTHHPCPTCLKLLISAGITRIVYGKPYRTDEIPSEFLTGIQLDLYTEQVP